jgi:inosose dehydratase
MRRQLNRRDFTKALTAGLGALAVTPLWAHGRRQLKIGHTGITWGFSPDDAEGAVRDVANLGYHAYESFGNVLEAWEDRGGFEQLLAEVELPLHKAYTPVNLTNPEDREGTVTQAVAWGELIRKCGGSVAVLGPNNVRRQSYDFAASRANIVAALNDIGMALMDIGIIGALHPHTGTCVETGEESRAIMESVDTRYVKFGPDVGQLLKAGDDPVPIVEDFASVIHHVHLKDYNGGPDFLGYCPLGQGNVDVEAIVDTLEASGNEMVIMVELDPNEGDRPMPMTPLETARISKEYLTGLGYEFRG